MSAALAATAEAEMITWDAVGVAPSTLRDTLVRHGWTASDVARLFDGLPEPERCTLRAHLPALTQTRPAPLRSVLAARVPVALALAGLARPGMTAPVLIALAREFGAEAVAVWDEGVRLRLSPRDMVGWAMVNRRTAHRPVGGDPFAAVRSALPRWRAVAVADPWLFALAGFRVEDVRTLVDSKQVPSVEFLRRLAASRGVSLPSICL